MQDELAAKDVVIGQRERQIAELEQSGTSLLLDLVDSSRSDAESFAYVQ